MDAEAKARLSEGEALQGLELVWTAVASIHQALKVIQTSELGHTSGTRKVEDELRQLEDSTAAVSALVQAHRVRTRSKFTADATLIIQRTHWHATVTNVSVDGCGLTLLEPLESMVTIPFDGVNISRPGTLRWSKGLRFGVEFSADKGLAQSGELEEF